MQLNIIKPVHYQMIKNNYFYSFRTVTDDFYGRYREQNISVPHNHKAK